MGKRKDFISEDDLTTILKAAIEAGNPVDDFLAPYKEKYGEDYTGPILEGARKDSEYKADRKYERGCEFARYARVIGLGKGDINRGVFEAKRAGWDSDDRVIKALTAGSPSAGGSLVPTPVSTDFIHYLTEENVFLQNSRRLDMPSGQLSIPRSTSGATAAYTSESTVTNASQGVSGSLDFSFKKLVAITPTSNSLLRFSNPSADAWVRDDLSRVMSKKLDETAFFSNGEPNKPRGLANLVHADNTQAQTGTSQANRITDLKALVNDVLGSNATSARQSDYTWAMSPAVFLDLALIVGATEDSTNIFGKEMFERGTLLGYPVVQSNRFATTGNEDARQDIFFWLKSEFVNAMSTDLSIDAFDGAAYNDSTGTVVSGVSRDETVLRAVIEHDINLRHVKSGSVLTGVTTS